MKDRTGHLTSDMLARYSRKARHAAELELGWFAPMGEVLGLAPAGEAKQCEDTRPAAPSVSERPMNDPVELALAEALRAAQAAQRWATVESIFAELAERRRGRVQPEAAE